MYASAKTFISRLLFLYRVFLGGDKRVIANYFKENLVRKLQVGAGVNRINGWLNSDYFPLSFGVVHIDAGRAFPMDSDSFDYVFSEHMIEHIPYVAGFNMLKEAYRILKPGGKLRISTPDIHFLVELISRDNSDVEKAYVDWVTKEFAPYAHPLHKQIFVVNNFFYNFGHTFLYDKALLRDLLSDVGFRVIKEVEISKSDDHELEGLEHESKIPNGFLRLESMIFEATK